MATPPIPLSGWADSELRACGVPAIAALSGAALLAQRMAWNSFTEGVSLGGGCRFYATRDGHVALNLARQDDRDLLPALFGNRDIADLEARFASADAAAIVARGRELGLAIASIDERPASADCAVVAQGLPVASEARPLVVDLSALWAGPLAASLLQLAGAEVIKVESATRPDAMRTGDPALFERLNAGKQQIALDLRDPSGRDALLALIRRARFVIEAARPRAFRQLGIDADALVREVPGLVWISITGHGVDGGAENWVGFGDDCGVAGGLSAALRDATGRIGFVGDAIADPLTGIHAARHALDRYRSGIGGHLVLSMSGTVAEALAAERRRDPAGLADALRQWTSA